MGVREFWNMFQALGGARQGQCISLGMTSFEDVIAEKLRAQNPSADIHQRISVPDIARSCGEHVVDIISISDIDNCRTLTQFEVKSRAGIPHTVAGAHSNDAENMLRYAEVLRQRYGCDKAVTKVIRRGGLSIPEHSSAGIITEKLEDYLTNQEILEIDTTEEKLIIRVCQHAGEKGFDIFNDSVIDANQKGFKDWLVEIRSSSNAKNAYDVGQKKAQRMRKQ